MFSGKRKMYGNFFIFETGKDQYSFSVNLIFPHRKNRENLFPPPEQKKAGANPGGIRWIFRRSYLAFLAAGAAFLAAGAFVAAGAAFTAASSPLKGGITTFIAVF